MGIFGGLGGVMLLDELRRGGIGAMTGFAYPEALVEIINLYFKGDHRRAMEMFNKFLPLILFENQEGINLSIRKEGGEASRPYCHGSGAASRRPHRRDDPGRVDAAHRGVAAFSDWVTVHHRSDHRNE